MKNKKKKILFLLPSLEGGGSQRVMLTIMTYLCREKYTPMLALVKKEGEFLSQIPHDIKLYDLDAAQVRFAIFKIIRLIKTTKPDIVFSTLGHLNLMIAVLKPFLPKEILYIARESNTLSIQNKSEKYPKLFDWLFRKVYKNFDLIITQSLHMKKDLVINYNIDNNRTKVIYNPLPVQKIEKAADESGDADEYFDRSKINLLCIGRLDPQKGYDLLIEAARYLDERFVITILGDGEIKDELKELAAEKSLTNRIIFKGFTKNPYAYLRYARLLILPSRYEGFANVVLEANLCGKGVVAFEAPGVDDEIIKEGFNGFLVPGFDTKKLSLAIEKASDFDFDTKALKEYTKERFDARKITKEYEDTIENFYKNICL